MSAGWMRTVDLCRYYRRGQHEVRALDGVGLSLDQGDFLGVIGASGSGKSTLLNLLAGLDTPTAGHIEVAGTVLGRLPRRELAAYRARRVGMVFQAFNLISHRTALANVELALCFGATPRAERRAQAAAMLERLGLADRLHHLPADLSGGEQQRVAIARALVKRPDLILADEPTGNLDHENTRQIAKLLAELNQQGLTIVMATHDLELAGSLARQTLHLRYGRLVGGGDGEESGEPS